MPQVAVGIDVGEDFLDLAVIRPAQSGVRFRRVGLSDIENAPMAMLRQRLLECCPDAGPGWLALIDSPRWPRDLDCSQTKLTSRNPVSPGRALDSALRRMLRASAPPGAMGLSMFPTPALEYFARCAAAPACKPHLRSIYCHFFGPLRERWPRCGLAAESVSGGGNFTRFMLAGFLAFRAWESLDAPALEAYPDLQFRLWAGRRLLPKRAGKAALEQRVAINRRMRKLAGIRRSLLPTSLDQADAEVVAMSAVLAARQGSLAALEHSAEGSFLLTFADAPDVVPPDA